MKRKLLLALGMTFGVCVNNQLQAQCISDQQAYDLVNYTNKPHDAAATYFNYIQVADTTNFELMGVNVTSEMLAAQGTGVFDFRFVLYKGSLNSFEELLLEVPSTASTVGHHEVTLTEPLILEPGHYWLGILGNNSSHLLVQYSEGNSSNKYIYVYTDINNSTFDLSDVSSILQNPTSGYYFSQYLREASKLKTFDTIICTETYTHDGEIKTSDFYIDELIGATICDSVYRYNYNFRGTYETRNELSCLQSFTWPSNGEVYTESGTYTVDLGTNEDGCPIVETLNLTFSGAIDNTISLEENTLSVPYNEDYSYQWFLCADGMVSLAGVVDSAYTPTTTGAYSVLITNADECSSMSECVRVDYLSLSDVLINNSTVYPNPTKGMITLSLNEEIELTSIQLVDLNGKVLQSSGATTLSTMNYAINQNSGIYFLHLTTIDGSVAVIKLIKE